MAKIKTIFRKQIKNAIIFRKKMIFLLGVGSCNWKELLSSGINKKGLTNSQSSLIKNKFCS